MAIVRLEPRPNPPGLFISGAFMAREYVIRRRMADIDDNVNAEDYLSRTVYEEHEMIDIGLLDSEGNAILARKKMDPIGFIRHKPRE